MTMPTLEDLAVLRHALGIGPDIARKNWGYRNRYVTSPDNASVARLVDAGLMVQTRAPSELTGGDTCYSATIAGCIWAGLEDGLARRIGAALKEDPTRRSST